MAIGAAAGLALYRNADVGAPEAALPFRVPRRTGLLALALFVLLLAGVPLLAADTDAHGVALIDAFRAGSLVFGGSHVILPLVEQAMVPTGWISADGFLAGYGVVQAVPGPLFTSLPPFSARRSRARPAGRAEP
ncbi:chromate transporter [Roseomonas sp. GCM10028921]